MVLIVGLGNPGKSYEWTRHNVGFLLIDHLARRWGVSFKQKFTSALGACQVEGVKVFLQKPLTYMNASGDAVRRALDYFKVDDLLVASDDVALPLGTVRLLEKGGCGGHNGLRDIEGHLGTNEYKRLRIGIGAAGRETLSDYVLGTFTAKEREALEAIFDTAAEGIETFLNSGINAAMKQVNTEKK